MMHAPVALRRAAAAALALVFAPSLVAQAPPAPPSNLIASDHPWDDGYSIDVRWHLSPDDETSVRAYEVLKAVARFGETAVPLEFDRVDEVPAGTGEYTVGGLKREIRLDDIKNDYGDVVDIVSLEQTGRDKFRVAYLFEVVALGEGDARSAAATLGEPVAPRSNWFDSGLRWFAAIVAIFCGAVMIFIQLARTGRPLKIRKIAGLEAVDEAVGRATEMGRSCLFIPGILDMNDIQTIAGINILARVAKTAARYDAKIEVPTSRSLVMTTARETVHAAFLEAGRPDLYNEDHIYYVTDEQFGFVAYLQGMMVREKPAACFYMGSFYAESLILAETGNSIGAIQVAGTAQPAQLPFFVAACDYTLIGEEFFAASAYLTGTPEELGSLKGQDVGKIIVGAFLLIFVTVATIASIAAANGLAIAAPLNSVLNWVKTTMLT